MAPSAFTKLVASKPDLVFLSEAALYFGISGAVAYGGTLPDIVSHIRRAVGAVPGVISFRIDTAEQKSVPSWPRPQEWSSQPEPPIVAVGPVAAHGQRWGDFRLGLDVTLCTMNSPVRLARFIGEQIGLAFSHAALAADVAERHEEKARLRDQLATRRTIDRAAGMLAKQQRISVHQAVVWLRAHAQREGQPLRGIAESLLLTRTHVESVSNLRQSA